VIHPATELRYINDAIGYGVFATARIPRGTIVWTMDDLDRVIQPAELDHMAAPALLVVERYTFVCHSGDRVLCWDHAKYINHSCRANCLSPGLLDIEIAVRDIDAGEELTDDYGSLNLAGGFACACGWPECRGSVGPDDFEHLTSAWDAELRSAITDVPHVEQPLWDWIPDTQVLRIAASNPELMPSIRAHAFVGRRGAAGM
jgi:hypothetical protein